jgi:hypothetical protein
MTPVIFKSTRRIDGCSIVCGKRRMIRCSARTPLRGLAV